MVHFSITPLQLEFISHYSQRKTELEGKEIHNEKEFYYI